MDGFLLINKRAGFTSRDVVNQLMKTFSTRKIGHTGTLDPFAEGLLIIAINKATKAAPFLDTLHKTYIATLKLGKATDTLDKDGKIIKEMDVPLFNKEKIEGVLFSLLGKSEQLPPLYSAIKINGKPLYKYARNNEEIEIKPREIEIYKAELISFKKDEIKFLVEVKTGTYVRSLGDEIAKKLGTCGHLISLIRTQIGTFKIDDAVDIDDAKKGELISVIEALSFLKTIRIEKFNEKNIMDGKKQIFNIKDDVVLLITEHNSPLAVYERIDESIFKSKRGLF